MAEGKMYMSSLSDCQKIMGGPIITKFTGKTNGKMVFHMQYSIFFFNHAFLRKRGCVFFPRFSDLRFFSPVDAMPPRFRFFLGMIN